MTETKFPGETADYRKARDELLAAEIALKDQRERVAELRRKLPMGAPVPTDYVFCEGPADLSRNDPADFFETRFSDLFAPEKDRLIVQHLMFAPDAEQGCPMCSMWTDGFSAVAPHVMARVNFALVARADIAKLRAWGRGRGWDKLRLLSSHDNTFNSDYRVERDGHQLPAISVFSREVGGAIHHFMTTEGSLVFDHHRMMDLYTPVWNLFDLLPEGRGDWMPANYVT